MKPIYFNEVNSVLQKSPEYDEVKHGKCDDLPIFTNDEECISLWKMTWRERFKAFLFGKVWLRVSSGNTQPPVSLSVNNNVFENKRSKR